MEKYRQHNTVDRISVGNRLRRACFHNLKEHLDELHGRGYKTGMVLSKFLTSDISPSDQRPHDYLDAWVEILPL